MARALDGSFIEAATRCAVNVVASDYQNPDAMQVHFERGIVHTPQAHVMLFIFTIHLFLLPLITSFIYYLSSFSCGAGTLTSLESKGVAL